MYSDDDEIIEIQVLTPASSLTQETEIFNCQKFKQEYNKFKSEGEGSKNTKV